MQIPFSSSLPALSAILLFTAAYAAAQTPTAGAGESLFVQNCAFCHGRDAGGGEDGPDLTRSKLVAEDVAGDKIGPVVLNGRQDKGMPPLQVRRSRD